MRMAKFAMGWGIECRLLCPFGFPWANNLGMARFIHNSSCGECTLRRGQRQREDALARESPGGQPVRLPRWVNPGQAGSLINVHKSHQPAIPLYLGDFGMRPLLRFCFLLLLAGTHHAQRLRAQLPFYTDDTQVTPVRTIHFEFFNEFDALQSAQFPTLRQNTSNFKVNTGLPHNLELDFDAPYISIYRANGTRGSSGIGDTDMGIKWKFHQASSDSRVPALAATFYVEFPTGNVTNQLGSGMVDYWLNFILQQAFSEKTRLNANAGVVFAGNTSTGDVGIRTTRGQVFTMGVSLLHDFTPKWTLGAEVYAGIADNDQLGRKQLQGMLGGQYNAHRALTLTFGFIVGTFTASPHLGGQVGLAVDFPDLWRRPR